jgi:hypothetical protein
MNESDASKLLNSKDSLKKKNQITEIEFTVVFFKVRILIKIKHHLPWTSFHTKSTFHIKR